jgi:spoIIIJ-associated protein
MEWIEVQAKSIDDAVELALDRLGIVADELEFEVLEEPRQGLFARLGRGTARIRARVKPISREKPADRRRRRRGGNGNGSGNGGSHRSNSKGGRSRQSAPATVGASAEARSAATRESGAPAEAGAASAGNGPGQEQAEGGNRSRRRGRSRGRGGSQRANDGRASANQAEEHDVDSTAVLTIDEQADAAVQFTDELVRAFGLSAEVAAEVVEDDIELRINGEGASLGVLVGPKGATLHAMEELIRAVVQHAAGGQSARLHLDVAGYRERRRAALAAFALQVATEVQEQGAERALEPMSPSDRKVVHDAVAELGGVATTSVGEEPRRRVVIKPA